MAARPEREPDVSRLNATIELGIADDAYGRPDGDRLSGEDDERFLRTPLFTDLHIRKARRIVPYNLIERHGENDPAYEGFARFYADAVERRVEMVVSFQYRDAGTREGDRSDRSFVPSLPAYAAAVRRFRLRFPGVRFYSAWNEPNHPDQPLHRRPERAAAFSAFIQRELCPPGGGCTAVAGDIAQAGRWPAYLMRYRLTLERLGARPRIWGVHPYTDIARGDLSGVRRFRAAAPPGARVWITEGGSRRDRNPEAEQARDVRRLIEFGAPAAWVERVYLYHWREPDPHRARAFDSGLLNPDGTPRAVYRMIRARTR